MNLWIFFFVKDIWNIIVSYDYNILGKLELSFTMVTKEDWEDGDSNILLLSKIFLLVVFNNNFFNI